jgi:hemin uptake protein HemP
MDQTPGSPESPAEIVRAPETTHHAVRSGELFGTDREIVILHGGQAYRLRITRADKLILTK